MKVSQVAKRKTRRHFLLLQGTKSFFFDLLAQKLRAYGFKTTKINFNAGDSFFYTDPNVIIYKHSLDDWVQYISDISKMQGVTDLIVYDDSKKHHALAIAELKKFGVNIHVFADGYFDKNHITLEAGGTNGNSALPREPMFYMRTPTIHNDMQPQAIRNAQFKGRVYNLIYLLTAKLGDYNAEFKSKRKGLLKFAHKNMMLYARKLWNEVFYVALGKRKYFVATIEKNNSAFLQKTISSFAANTNKSLLVFNITGTANFVNAKKIIEKAASANSIGGNVFCIEDANLNRLISNSQGLITWDSIEGIAAINSEIPIIALGKTIYNFAGLTNQSKLVGFWRRRISPNPSLYGKFKNHVCVKTQINGGFFSRKGMEMAASAASHKIITSNNFGVGNNVSENV